MAIPKLPSDIFFMSCFFFFSFLITDSLHPDGHSEVDAEVARSAVLGTVGHCLPVLSHSAGAQGTTVVQRVEVEAKKHSNAACAFIFDILLFYIFSPFFFPFFFLFFSL